MEARKRLIAALDVDSKEKALDLTRILTPYVGMFKIGMELFYSCGPGIINIVREQGGEVFVDLKIHDIPNTVSRAVKKLTGCGASIINVHAAGGKDMMKAAAQAAEDESVRMGKQCPLVVAVTILTSIGKQELNNELCISGEVKDQVHHWSLMAQDAGLHGVVSSAREAPVIKNTCREDFKIITPGIRPAGSAAGDQKRIVTPLDAVNAGAAYLVVGRPIIAAPDPAKAAAGILQEMTAGE